MGEYLLLIQNYSTHKNKINNHFNINNFNYKLE